MANYGYKSTNPSNMETGVDGQLVVCIFDVMPENGWAYQVGARLGKRSGQPSTTSVRYVIYRNPSIADINPAERHAYTASALAATVMDTTAGGADVVAAIVETDQAYAPLESAVRLISGRRYGVGMLIDNGSIGYGTASPTTNLALQADSVRFWERMGLGSIPPDPIGSTTERVGGLLDAWIVYQPNRQPDKATTLTPANGATVAGLAPTFTFNFDDQDRAYGDTIKQYQFRLRQVGTTPWLWNEVFAAVPPGTPPFTISQAYTGPALTVNRTYEWQVRSSDLHGEWSFWSDLRTLTTAQGGTATLDGTPTGKTTSTTPPFQWRWSHSSALAANAVQIQLYQGKKLISTSPIIARSPTVASSALPGTLDTITWAQTTFKALTPGLPYSYAVRGRGTDGNWSQYSDQREFSVNAAPYVPTSVLPNRTSPAYTAPPLVTFYGRDVDSTAAQLTGKVRIFNSSNVQVGTDKNATLVAGTGGGINVTGKYQYQITAADLSNTYGTYKIAAYLTDELGATGPLSAMSTFVYAAGPVVTETEQATSPSTVGTNTPIFRYNAVLSGGATVSSAKLYLYDANLNPLGNWAPTLTNFRIMDSGYLHNGGVYFYEWIITDSNGLSGTSGLRQLNVVFTPPSAPGNMTASPHSAAFDAGKPSAVRLGPWVAADVAPEDVEAIVVARWRTGVQEANPAAVSDYRILARLQSPYADNYIDPHPRGGVQWTYGVAYVTRVGTDLVEGQMATTDITLNLSTVVLADALDGLQYRVVAHAWAPGAEDETTQDDEEFLTWGDNKARVSTGGHLIDRWAVTLFFYPDPDVPAPEDQIAACRALQQRGRELSLRIANDRVAWCKIRAARYRKEGGGIWSAALQLTEVSFVEGVI